LGTEVGEVRGIGEYMVEKGYPEELGKYFSDVCAQAAVLITYIRLPKGSKPLSDLQLSVPRFEILIPKSYLRTMDKKAIESLIAKVALPEIRGLFTYELYPIGEDRGILVPSPVLYAHEYSTELDEKLKTVYVGYVLDGVLRILKTLREVSEV